VRATVERVAGGHGLEPALPAERAAALVLLPIGGTALFYASPAELQREPWLQFLPQCLAYLALVTWRFRNTGVVERLGLKIDRVPEGVRWGLVSGLLLGAMNTLVILRLIPWLGQDITFLKDTPHAKVPVALMLPWTITLIAVFVELNFRGFLLGRLLALGRTTLGARADRFAPPAAVMTSALAFAFDPFLVATFQHLHWIAVWDGLIWGAIWVRLRNLYATIVAHATEVVVMYMVVRAALA
jgi:hypothetical protein